MRESRIEEYFCSQVEKFGGLQYKFVSPQRRHVPDRIVLFCGKIFFVELKAPGKEPSPAQLREHKRLRDQGFDVFVISEMYQVNTFVEANLL